MPTIELRRRSLAPSVEALVGEGAVREVMIAPDSKSGARFEWVRRGSERLVLKYQDARDDWIMRATGDVDGRRFAVLWESGLLDALPPVIDHAVIGAAVEGTVGAILLRDVSEGLLPLGDVPLPTHLHDQFLSHMAAMHAAFWGWRDDPGLLGLGARYGMFSPTEAEREAALGSDALVPKVMAEGWKRLPSVAPAAAGVIFPLLADPAPLIDALGSVPHTFVHGDWKAGNLGSQADGRTILLDFGEVPGEAAPAADLCWYLALNAARLSESKEAAISRYRAALEGHGIDTAAWWDRALGLELLGTMVQFGWEKALGGPGPELDWWTRAAVEGTRWL